MWIPKVLRDRRKGVDSPMPTEAVCAQCSSWLHSCANCAFYDEYSQRKCREPKADFGLCQERVLSRVESPTALGLPAGVATQ